MNTTPNPASVRTAVLAQRVREAKTPTYTTVTPKAPVREHLYVVETNEKYRRVLNETFANEWADMLSERDNFSDMDHATACWCMKGLVG